MKNKKFSLLASVIGLIGFSMAHTESGNNAVHSYYGMMGEGWGMMSGGYGFGWMFFGSIVMLLAITILVLLIVLLIKQIKKK